MTTTLQAIGVTLALGSVTLGVTLFAFGQALRSSSSSSRSSSVVLGLVAPRCVARPHQVISNALPALQPRRQPNGFRYWPSSCFMSPTFLSWIPYVLSLNYNTLLDGVPGTGTRQNGMAGTLLRCQLDAIVMLRFHAIGFKLATLVTILCLFVLFPVYWNSECYFEMSSLPGCWQQTTQNSTTTGTPYLTNYGRTTIANVPSLVATTTATTDEQQQHENATILLRLYAVCFVFLLISTYWIHLIHAEWIQILAMRRVYYLEHDVWGERKRELQSVQQQQQQQQQEHSAPTPAAAVAAVDGQENNSNKMMMKQEQPQPSRPRRDQGSNNKSSSFFTLPQLSTSSSSFRNKTAQAQEQMILGSLSLSKSQILPQQQQQQQQQQQPSASAPAGVHRQHSRSGSACYMNKIDEQTQLEQQNNNRNNTSSRSSNSEPHLLNRDPWVPHPEHRDTVPNIALYSVLVGGLPSLPEEAIEYHQRNSRPDDNALHVYCKKRASIDWQLALTSAFFDHCVPNQPGFSSSVAAVTILPSSRHIAIAWRKWYAAAAQLRRLRFIRQLIANLRDFDIQVDDYDDDEESDRPRSHSIHKNDSMSSGLGRATMNLRVPAGDNNDDLDNDENNRIEPMGTTTQTRLKPRLDSDDFFSSICSNSSKESLHPFHRDSVNNNLTGNSNENGNNSKNKNDTAMKDQTLHESTTRYYHQEVLGCVYDQDLESQFYQDLQFGPEQTAVYSREFAQAAAPCCPNGCWSDQIANLSIDDLIDMERDAVAAVHQANMELLHARRQATRTEYKDSSIHSKHRGCGDGHGGNTGLVTFSARLNGTTSPSNGEHQQQQLSKVNFVGTRMPSSMSLEASIYNKAFTASMKAADKSALLLSSSVSQSKCPTSPPISQHMGSPTMSHQRKPGSFDMANVPSSLVLEADLFSRAQNHGHGRHVRKNSWDSGKSPSAGPGSVHSSNSKSKKTPMDTFPQRHHQPQPKSASLSLEQQHRNDGDTCPPPLPIPAGPNAVSPAPAGETNYLTSTAFDPVRLGELLAYDVSEYNKSNNSNVAEPSLLSPEHFSHHGEARSPAPLASKRTSEKRENTSLPPLPPRPSAAAKAPESEKTFLTDTEPGLHGLLLVDDIAEYNKTNNDHTESSLLSLEQFQLVGGTSCASAPINLESHERSSFPPLPPTPATATAAVAPVPSVEKSPLTGTELEPGMLGRLLADDIAKQNEINSNGALPLVTRHDEPFQLLDAPRSALLASKSSHVDEYGNSNNDATSKCSTIEFHRNSLDELPQPPRERLNMTSHCKEPSPLYIRDDTSVPSVQTRTDATHPGTRSPERRDNHPSTNWELVQSIVADVSKAERSSTTVSDGSWRFPTISKVFSQSKKKTKLATNIIKEKTKDRLTELTRESTYAVVTFTSRQAAVAARHCLADGRGADRWMSLQELPIPPLADAAACDLLACRNCCRPVTISLDEREKMWRNYFALLLLSAIYIFYTIPLTLASTLVAPENLEAVMPEFFHWVNEWWYDFSAVVSGLMQSLIWTAFFASCPVIFKAIANFGSKATSVANAEFKALQYFWWFMLTAAFTGPLLANALLAVFRSDITFESSIRDIMRTIGREIPTTIAASWLNWIILRFTFLLPLNYLLNINAFVFHWLGMKCCSRMVRGGGPGGPVPYRVYVDSCMVILCLLALAPASPLIAPVGFFYFLLCQPLFRWNAIFVYRPKYDGGGLRWPFLSDMMFSALFMAQVLLTTQMALKMAVGPAVVAAVPILPTIIIYRGINKRFRQAFTDAALLQTSLLDGWDTNEESTLEKREEFRRFLVDAHKAAYVPICIAGNDDEDATLTAEPAVVVPAESDMLNEIFDVDDDEQDNIDDHDDGELDEVSVSSSRSRHAILQAERRSLLQRGATMRRAARTVTAMQQTAAAARQRRFTSGSRSMVEDAARQRRFTSGSRSMIEDVLSTLEGMPSESAFDRSLPVLPSSASLRNLFQYQQERNDKLE